MKRNTWGVSLWICLGVVFSLMSCSTTPECQGDKCQPSSRCSNGISELTIDPNGRPCLKNCDCNNQSFVGFCDRSDRCVSKQREDCQVRDQKEQCLLEIEVGCRVGARICQDEGLDSKKWGDCKPITPVPEQGGRLCGDGVDNDCDGKTDKADPDCKDVCQPGALRDCYTGPSGTQKEGNCVDGKETCTDDGEWDGVCKGERLPTEEVCNQKDDDCDGSIDEELPECQKKPCRPGQEQSCYRGPEGTLNKGECKSGTQTCTQEEKWGPCKDDVHPANELCNGKDDNCDGQIDNNLTDIPVCAKQKGGCRGAKATALLCQNGSWSPCTETEYKRQYADYAATDTPCDNKDNDCDGKTDEDPPFCVTTFAGSGTKGFQNGPAATAKFNRPSGIAIDKQGNVYVSDTNNHSIRKIDTLGNVSTFAGSGTSGFRDGSGTQAQFNSPNGLAFDSAGILYVADTENHKIRKIDMSGKVSTFAGSTKGYKAGDPLQAQFESPFDIVINNSKILYIADTFNYCIRYIDPRIGRVFGRAGDCKNRGFADGQASAARFALVRSIVSDTSGNVYVSDTDNNRIRKIDSQGNVITIAGSGIGGYRDDVGTKAQFNNPVGLARAPSGELFVADDRNGYVRKIDTSWNVTTVAGDGTRGFKDGPSNRARFNGPYDIAIYRDFLYVVDKSNNRIRKFRWRVSSFP